MAKFAGREQGIALTNAILSKKDFNKLLNGNHLYKGEPTDEALKKEVQELIGDCPTCNDHLKDDLTSREGNEKKHILKEGRDAEQEFRRKHF